jgi:hypothetical protein
MTTALPDPPDDLDPDHFAALGAAFMGGKMLCVAAELDLFAKLADGPRSVDEMVEATGLPRRSLDVLLSGLTALGVLELADGRYANGRDAQAYLAGRTSVDLRPGLRLYNHIVYPMWMGFEGTVRTGQPARHGAPSEEFARIFSEGVEAWTLSAARALPARYDFAPHARILDVGGGTGSYLLPILARWPGVRGTLFELPPSADAARRRLAGEPAASRVEIVEGDALFDPIPTGHDLVICAGFLHLFNADQVVMVLRRIRGAVDPGVKLLIVDQWLDRTRTRPVFAAMLAATYLLISGAGGAYSVEEGARSLEAAGFRFLEHRPLAGVTSLVIAEAA